MGQGEGSAEHGKILGKHEDLASIDQTVAGNDPVARNFVRIHAEIHAAVGFETVHFDKAARVQQPVDAFPGAEFAGGMLFGHAGFSAAGQGLGAFLNEDLEQFTGTHEASFRRIVVNRIDAFVS